MAVQQYRVNGMLDWQSNSGNALLAIVNRLNSGKKLTLRSFEVNLLTSTTVAGVTAAPPTFLNLCRATVNGGIPVTLTPLDTNAGALPSSFRILTGATTSSVSNIRRVSIVKQLTQTNTAWGAQFRPVPRWGHVARVAGLASDPERYTIRPGESIALYCSDLRNSLPLRISLTVIRSATPKRTFTTTYFTNITVQDQAALAIVNDAGSGETYTIRDLMVEEVGTYDSPYLQLVPIGNLIESSASREVTALKMDTDYDDAATYVEIRADVPVFPYGMPENAFADASAGSPKGFNYLKTKDFLGPVYRAIFPEMVCSRSAAMPDTLGHLSTRHNDLRCQKAGIVLNEGEGLGLVSAAETAAGATAAVGVSGWACMEFAATFDLEPAQIPTISVTGMIANSRWRIERVSDSSEVATGVTADGTASVVYDTEDTPLDLRLKVRKASGAPYYKPFEVTFNLTSAGLSIPVSQVADA